MKLWIKELREQQGMTQKELAEKMQVSFQTISKWENGVNMPDITHIPRLAEVFSVSADVILGLEPMDKSVELRQFDNVDYWSDKRELVKQWKEMYWNEDYFRFLVKDVWRFTKPVSILDFGCGYGFLGSKFLPLLPKGSSYTGIELDGAQIREAEALFADTGYKYKFVQQDIYDFEPGEKYDMVVALVLLSYVQQPEELIEKMKSALRPGGMLLLMDFNMEVEKAGYFSGLEREENGGRCPDFTPVWEYETVHGERDYRMGTKLPYLMKKCGLKNIQARISDQVIIYDPADVEKSGQNQRFRHVFELEDSYGAGISYFTGRGLSYQKALEFTEYYKRTKDYFDTPEALAVKTSGVYFVYATL